MLQLHDTPEEGHHVRPTPPTDTSVRGLAGAPKVHEEAKH